MLLCSVVLYVPILSVGAVWLYSIRQTLVTPRDFFQDYTSALNAHLGNPVYMDLEQAFLRYWEMKQQNLWIRVNPHPPTSVLVAIPFTVLDYERAAILWNVSSCMMLIASFILVSRQLGWRITNLYLVTACIGLMMLWPPLVYHMLEGQTGCLLLLLMTAAWICARSQKDVACGAFLGFAATLKLYPIAFFLYFAARRRYRVVLSGVAVFAGVSFVTALLIGAEAYRSYFRIVLPAISRWLPDPVNVSIVGFFYRLFAAEDPIAPLADMPRLANLLSAVAIAAVVITWLAISRRKRGDFDGEFGLSVTAMLLISSMTWQHYFVVLLLPLAIAGQRAGWRAFTADWLQLSEWIRLSLPIDRLALSFFSSGRHGPLLSLAFFSLPFYGLVCLFIAQARNLQWRRFAPEDPLEGPWDLSQFRRGRQ